MSNRPRHRASGTKKTVVNSPEKPGIPKTPATSNQQPATKPTSLKKTLYLSLAIVSLIIGIHRTYIDSQTESISVAVGYNYWIFMITIAFLLLLRYERKKNQA